MPRLPGRKNPRPCPCGSTLRYSSCCGPLHDGVHAAATPEALMRSRFSAFALGRGRYLVDTLAAGHPDRNAESDPDGSRLALVLSRAKDTQRFLSLEVVEVRLPDRTDPARTPGDPRVDQDRGEVLFRARIFERGVDRSFTERSRFVRENGTWRYEGGDKLGDA